MIFKKTRKIKKKKKDLTESFTLIELLVVVAIIAILSAIVFTVLNSSKEKANKAAAKQTASGILHEIEVASIEGGDIAAPINPSTGGGPICTNCTSTATWPSIEKTGYVYKVTPKANISDGNFSFSITKPSDNSGNPIPDNPPPDNFTLNVNLVNGSGGMVGFYDVGGSSGGGGGGNTIVTKSLSGNVVYEDTATTLMYQMHNVTITLKQNGETKYTTTTPATGDADYSFPAVDQGVYDVYFSKPENPMCVINATDGLKVSLFVNGIISFRATDILASDVYQNSPSTIITASNDPAVLADNNSIKKFAVGLENFSATGRWVFTNINNKDTLYSGFPISFANSAGFSNITVTIGDSDVIENFTSGAYGNTNGGNCAS